MSIDKVPPGGTGRPSPLRHEQLERARGSSQASSDALPPSESGSEPGHADEVLLSPEGRELAQGPSDIPKGTLSAAELRSVLQWLEDGGHRDPTVLEALARQLASDVVAPQGKADPEA